MVLIVIMKIILVKRVFQERILWLENNLEKINNYFLIKKFDLSYPGILIKSNYY